MTLQARTVLAASTLALAALAARGAPADHLPERAAAYRVLAPVEAMPPAHRAAYVAALREELAAHGYDAGPPGAVVGDPRLAAAIRAYQRDAGLPVDGVASRELLDHLMFALPKVYAGYGPPPARPPAPLAPPVAPGPEPGAGYRPGEVSEEPLADPSQPPSEQATAAPPATAPPGAQAPPGPTIGGVVSQVQAELKRRGYYAGAVDGRFTPETSAAVRRFQEDNGLPVDGVINNALLDALER